MVIRVPTLIQKAKVIVNRELHRELPKYAWPGIVVMFVIFVALNAFGYYLWDIVRSAYKKVKEEDKNKYRSNLTTTNQNTSQSYQIISDYETKLLNQSSGLHVIEES